MKPFFSCKKLFSATLIAIIVLMSIPTLRKNTLCPIHRFFETGPTATRIKTIREDIENKSWENVGIQVSQGLLASEISFGNLEKIASLYPSSPFEKALQASSSILSLLEPTGLTAEKTFPIALFAETDLQKEIQMKKFYWSKQKFGRELQYDPETKSFFIHLGTHGIKPLGIGRKKVVTKTIRYDRERPEIMARGLTRCNVKKEMQAMEWLRTLPGILEAEALMHHKDPKHGHRLMTIVTKIYRPGSLHNVLKKASWRLTLKERLQIANDLLEGLASIHSKGLVHRDLGARNYFVDITSSNPESRSVRAVVADMGRTIPAIDSAAKPVQGNSSYLAPESINREKMVGKDYYQSDLFATGCVLWHLYFEKTPLWRQHHPYKKADATPEELYDRFIELLSKAHDGVANNRAEDPVQREFESILIQMTDKDPAKRGDAASCQKRVAALLEEVNNKTA